MRLIGKTLMAIGACAACYAIGRMPISVPSDVNLDAGQQVVNFAMVANRELTMLAGAACAIVGAIFDVGGAILESINRQQAKP